MARGVGGGVGQGGPGAGAAEMAAVHHLTAQQAKAIKDGLEPKPRKSGGDAMTALVTAVVMIAVLVIMIYFGK